MDKTHEGQGLRVCFVENVEVKGAERVANGGRSVCDIQELVHDVVRGHDTLVT